MEKCRIVGACLGKTLEETVGLGYRGIADTYYDCVKTFGDNWKVWLPEGSEKDNIIELCGEHGAYNVFPETAIIRDNEPEPDLNFFENL